LNPLAESLTLSSFVSKEGCMSIFALVKNACTSCSNSFLCAILRG
jgi:hypothetical protein